MKKQFLICVVVLGLSALVLGSCAGQATVPTSTETPIKIGVIYPLTGPAAIQGGKMADSAKWAFEELGWEVAGKKITAIVEDDGGTATMALDKARKLVEYDKVCMILGPLLGPSALAVASYLDKKEGVIQICTHPVPPDTVKYRWTFTAGGVEPQLSYPMGLYAYDKIGLKKIDFMSEDTMGGHSFLPAFNKAFTSEGGQVIQEQYTPFPCNDFASYLAKLEKADAVVAWYQGSDAIEFLTAYQDFGIRKKMPLVAAFHGAFFAPFILHALRPEVADSMIGEYCATPYTALLDTDANKHFIEIFEKRFGYTPDNTESGVYAGAQLAFEALKATGGGTNPEKLQQAILAAQIETPEGLKSFDPETRLSIIDTYICRVDKVEGDYVFVPVYTYSGKDILSQYNR